MFVYLFWNGLYISKFKYKTKEGLLLLGRNFVEENIRNNKNIMFQILVYKDFLNTIYQRKKDKQPIRRTDHQIVLYSMMSLIVLKQIELEDDIDRGLWFPPKYKKRLIKI